MISPYVRSLTIQVASSNKLRTYLSANYRPTEVFIPYLRDHSNIVAIRDDVRQRIWRNRSD